MGYGRNEYRRVRFDFGLVLVEFRIDFPIIMTIMPSCWFGKLHYPSSTEYRVDANIIRKHKSLACPQREGQ